MKIGKHWPLRPTVRFKVLLLLASVLAVAMATYQTLAIRLVTEDRLAYAFLLNQRTAASLAAEVQSSMESLVARLELFAALAVRAEDDDARQDLARALFMTDLDMARVILYRRGEGGGWVRAAALASGERLQPFELSPADLEELDRTTPVPMALLEHGAMLVQNRSLEPSAHLLTVAVAERERQGGRPSFVVVADIIPRRLQALFSDSTLCVAYLVDREGAVLLHPERDVVMARASFAARPLVRDALARRLVHGGAMELAADAGRRYLGAFAHGDLGRLTVLVETDREQAFATTRRLVRLSWLFGIAILLTALLASVFFSRLLTTPLSRLSAATRELGRGNYAAAIEVTSRDEIGELAESFRQMAAELKEGQRKLIRSEKLAAFGQLGAGITHEVKNPLAAIRGFAQLGLHYLDDAAQVRESFEMVEREADRCLTILQNFLAFAQHDTRKRITLDAGELVAHAVRLAAHQVRIANVKIHESYEATRKVSVIPGQLQQVVLNLLLNAQQAQVKGGNVWVSTRDGATGGVEIEVRDDGPGIAPEALAQIMQPFYTTKEKGTGLGLSVSKEIVEAHGGALEVSSTIGEGATFKVILPEAQAAPPEAAEL